MKRFIVLLFGLFQIVNPGTGGGGGAPTANPTGGANNYAPIASPTFTGTATAPTVTATSQAMFGYFPSGPTITPYYTVKIGMSPTQANFASLNMDPQGNAHGFSLDAYDNNSGSRYIQLYDLDLNATLMQCVSGASCTFSVPAAFTSISNSLMQNGAAATIASATTIAPVTPLVTISGTTAIATITLPTGFTSGCFDILATGAWTTTTAGNIQAAMTAVANTPYRACYWTSVSKWTVK